MPDDNCWVVDQVVKADRDTVRSWQASVSWKGYRAAGNKEIGSDAAA